MTAFHRRGVRAAGMAWGLALLAGSVGLAGCAGPKPGVFYQHPTPPAPLGARAIDPIFQMQEENADAAKFVVYVHEFKLNKVRLNTAGEDHVKQIAHELQRGAPYPVVIERSFTSKRTWPGEGQGRFNYPVHPNPELDNKRREAVVRALVALGVPDADRRVVVAPAFSQEYTNQEAERAYAIGINQFGRGFGFGFGGFGGFGFGGLGGFGGFGIF